MTGGRYRTIVVDFPWLERGGGKIKRGADRHYPLVKSADGPALIRSSGMFDPTADAHLYFWTTNNFLADGLWMIGELGFDYKTNIVWTKAGRIGLGQYFRGAHELCLFATRGKGFNVRTESRAIPSHIDAPRGRHSAKPAAFYDLVEARSRGPFLEMFARKVRGPAWHSWGNEVNKAG